MAIHRLQMGVQRTSSQTGFGTYLSMFPQTEPALTDQRSQVDWSKGNCSFAMSRTFDFGAGAYVSNTSIPASLSPESWGSTGLNNYVKMQEIIANGDTIVTHSIPHDVIMHGVYVKVLKTITPFTFDLRIRGQAASVGGPKVLATGINGATLSSQYIDFKSLAAVGSKDVFFDQNDALELIITALPANVVNSDGSNGGGIIGSAFVISPIVTDPRSGLF